MTDRLAYAKINLFLDIEGIREDGYHNIVSVMQTINWADRISLQSKAASGIRLTCSAPSIPTDRSNTAYRAAEVFFAKLGSTNGLHIHIEKNIPSSAGLAGGSADAAAVLLGLNELMGEPFSSSALLEMGATIGADVPFCMIGGTQLTKGIGDVIEPFPPMPSCHLVCAKIGDGVSTPEAYRAIDAQNDFFKIPSVKWDKLTQLRNGFQHDNPKCLSDGLFNIFEATIEKTHPGVSLIKSTLLAAGADVAMMSGSGPSVFGVFENPEHAHMACDKLCAMGAHCAVCAPVPQYGGTK